MKSLKVKKTDLRFKLYNYGFTHFIEIPQDEWSIYNQIVQQCRKMFKDEFFESRGKVYTDGNWHAKYYHRGKKKESKRIYFRGEKFITLLRMNLDESKNNYYL